MPGSIPGSVIMKRKKNKSGQMEQTIKYEGGQMISFTTTLYTHEILYLL